MSLIDASESAARTTPNKSSRRRSSTARATATHVDPLGPDSLIWTIAGDYRNHLTAAWAAVMQNLHPGLAAGVLQHSTYAQDPWKRLERSGEQITGVVYDGPEALATATTIRNYHAHIKGVDEQGRRYSALDPETFYWAHAVFTEQLFRTHRLLHGPLSSAQKEQLYAESCQWYEHYGVSSRPMPADYAAFRSYWTHVCTEVLEDNPAARLLLDTPSWVGQPPGLTWMPERIWATIRPAVMGRANTLIHGMMDPEVRDLLGISWTAADQAEYVVEAAALRHGAKVIPRRYRWHPRATAGWRRAAKARRDAQIS